MAMSVLPSTVDQPPVAERRARRPAAIATWLVLCCYLVGAVVVTAPLWADPASRAQVGDPHDVDQFAWYVRYAATAVSHGRLPALVTTALNPPQGVNLMWNTSFLLPGMLLTPVTLLAGPQTSLTVVLTLAMAGSAAALFWLLRRWRASLPAAALGGAVYGFSPALINSGIGHYNLAFAVLPPLIIDAVLRILTGRGNVLASGAWLGLLVGAQVFIGEELLADTAVACLVLAGTLTLTRPRMALGRVRGAALGLAAAAVVAAAISGHALWVQLHGPLTEHPALLNNWSSNPAYFVDPGGNLLIHTRASAAAVAGFHLGAAEVLAYLGWPMLAVLTLAMISFWRDLRVRVAAVMFVVLELCSLGGGNQADVPGWLLPWHWLEVLPVLVAALPNRFSLLADGAAAAVLAFSLDLALSAARTKGWQASAAVAAVAAAAVVPLIPLPYQVAALPPVPAGWTAAFAGLRLAPDAPVLVVPVGNVGHTMTIRWQADTGEPGSMIGGYFIGPAPGTRLPIFDASPTKSTTKYLDWIWDGSRRASPSFARQLRADLAYWHPAAVVAVTSPGAPTGRLLTALLGRPSLRTGSVLAWHLTGS
jgi:hypothetical protein